MSSSSRATLSLSSISRCVSGQQVTVMSIIYFYFSSAFGLLMQTSGSLAAKYSTMFISDSLTFACLLFCAEQVVNNLLWLTLAERQIMRVVRVNQISKICVIGNKQQLWSFLIFKGELQSQVIIFCENSDYKCLKTWNTILTHIYISET